MKQENKTDESISRETAIAIGNDIIARIRECAPVRVSFAGSIRRESARVHDIDILVSPYSPIVHSLLGQDYPESELLWIGPDRISFLLPIQDLIDTKIQVDVRFIEEESWGPALQYFTGSREHNVSLRQIARAKSLKLNEFGLWDSSNQRVDDGTEGSVYRMLGLRWLPPRYRNGYIRGKNTNPPERKWERWCVEHMKRDFCTRDRMLARAFLERKPRERTDGETHDSMDAKEAASSSGNPEAAISSAPERTRNH